MLFQQCLVDAFGFFFFKFLFKQLSVAEAPFSGDGLIASGALSSPVYGRVVGT